MSNECDESHNLPSAAMQLQYQHHYDRDQQQQYDHPHLYQRLPPLMSGLLSDDNASAAPEKKNKVEEEGSDLVCHTLSSQLPCPSPSPPSYLSSGCSSDINPKNQQHHNHNHHTAGAVIGDLYPGHAISNGEQVVCSTSPGRATKPSTGALARVTPTPVDEALAIVGLAAVVIPDCPPGSGFVQSSRASDLISPSVAERAMFTATAGQRERERERERAAAASAQNAEEEGHGMDAAAESSDTKEHGLPCLDDNWGSGQLLDHPHIIYPTMLQSQVKDDNGKIMASKEITSITSIVTSTPSSLPPSRCASRAWEMDHDRIYHRESGRSVPEQDSDDAEHESADGIEDESSDSEVERRRRAPAETHRAISVKRRKVSEGDDDDDDADNISDGRTQRYDEPFVSVSSSPRRHSQPTNFPSTSSASSPSPTRPSSQRPSSWPARKRRSILAADPSLLLSTFSESSNGQTEMPSIIDTSSLSLLSATSELVSAGTIPILDNDRRNNNDGDFLPPLLLSPPTPSSSSASSSASSPTESRCSSILDSFAADNILGKQSSVTNSTRRSASSSSSSFCRHLRYCFPLLGACRKRNFEDAIELTRPLGNDPSVEYKGWWLGSIKRRKIHHFPTRWTSTLSPSPYVKLMAMRDFWDVMRSRLDLSWLDLWTITSSNWKEGFQIETREMDIAPTEGAGGSSSRRIGRDFGETNVRTTYSSTTSGSLFMNSTTASTGAVDSGAALAKRRISRKEELKDESKSQSPDDRWSDDEAWSIMKLRNRRRTVVQHPSTGLFLRGLWEEEERCRRQRQMIPECVHKPLRSKILNRKPIPRMASVAKNNRTISWIKPKGSSDSADSSSPSFSSDNPGQTAGNMADDQDDGVTEHKDAESGMESEAGPSQQQQIQADKEMMLRKKHGPAAATVRSNALSEGYDLNEYKPWRDGTITPHQGSIRTLCQLRNTMLDPWPIEESRAKDECTRVLHRMREQLNVVINLQIHLRSVIKTTPSHMSFLLSIRHPGQVSVELLNALYGPQFMQTSAFRSIEQLLWGKYQPPQIEHDHPQHRYDYDDHGNYQQQQPTLPPPAYSYDHNNHETFESVVDARVHGDQQQQQQHRNDHDHYHAFQQQHQHFYEQHATGDEEGCEFEEEFDDQTHGDPVLEMSRHVVMDSTYKVMAATVDKVVVGDDVAVSEESEIEALGISSRRLDGMLVDAEHELGC
ncbi:hypothetical protein BGZ58_010588 [Dissophora ornata]|nr:hypothetical protein BGZ58_010588 [Dissophora ornata]